MSTSWAWLYHRRMVEWAQHEKIKVSRQGIELRISGQLSRQKPGHIGCWSPRLERLPQSMATNAGAPWLHSGYGYDNLVHMAKRRVYFNKKKLTVSSTIYLSNAACNQRTCSPHLQVLRFSDFHQLNTRRHLLPLATVTQRSNRKSPSGYGWLDYIKLWTCNFDSSVQASPPNSFINFYPSSIKDILLVIMSSSIINVSRSKLALVILLLAASPVVLGNVIEADEVSIQTKVDRAILISR